MTTKRLVFTIIGILGFHGIEGYAALVSKTNVLPSVTNLFVTGRFNVTLHTGARTSSMVLRGEERAVQRVVYTVEQGTLKISSRLHTHGRIKAQALMTPVSIDVYLPTLHDLTYKGQGNIKGQHLHLTNAHILIQNTGDTRLEGQIQLKSLTLSGRGHVFLQHVSGQDITINLSGRPSVELLGRVGISCLMIKDTPTLNVRWVDAHHFFLRTTANAAPVIQLAGRANRFDVVLGGKSFLDARYLRARQTFVRTEQHALAKLSSTRRQHTLATDASDIYFYNLPPYRADFMAKNGAVLDMRDWSLEALQEYTPYNKW